MSPGGALAIARRPGMERRAAVARPLPPPRLSATCRWCLWDGTAEGRDAHLRLAVMRQAHEEVWHPDRVERPRAGS